MKEINLPPFYVGQKVVFIVDSFIPQFKKGAEFVIKDIKRFCGCDKWVVDVGVYNYTGYSHCGTCGNKYQSTTVWSNAKYFAPLLENFQEISYSEVVKEEKRLVSSN